MLEPATYLGLLGELQAAFLAAVETADADAPVPSCGAWSVGDLVDHLAGVHHWAAAMARGERKLEASDVAPDTGSWSLGAANAVPRPAQTDHERSPSRRTAGSGDPIRP